VNQALPRSPPRSRGTTSRGYKQRGSALHVLQSGAVAAGAALGGRAASYFLDPELGHVRRARLREELPSRSATKGPPAPLTTRRPRFEG
jgi:hypothetical protein